MRERGSKAHERWHLCCCLFLESREANLKCRFGNDLELGHETCVRGTGGARIGMTTSPKEEGEHSNGAGGAAAPPRACITQREQQRARFQRAKRTCQLEGQEGLCEQDAGGAAADNDGHTHDSPIESSVVA